MSAQAPAATQVVKVSLVDQVADIVRERVGSGQLKPGETLHIERLARELGVSVAFRDAVPRSEVPRLLAEADALVNPTRGNAADKVVFEAAAAGVPPLASSPVFDGFLPPELRFDGPHELAQRLRSLDRASVDGLRAKVEAEHSAAHWADAVLAVAR
jgi:glycosyltransferase involved in cell wall biosynthesis